MCSLEAYLPSAREMPLQKSRDAVFHQLRVAKSAFHCQCTHNSLPLRHPINLPVKHRTSDIKNLRKPSATQLHCFEWSTMTISWQGCVLEGRWEITGWSRRVLISNEKVRSNWYSETQRKLCLRVKAKTQTWVLFPYQLIFKIINKQIIKKGKSLRMPL